MKTIKELADELGVAKQTINNNKPEDIEYTKIKNTNYIDEELEKIIVDNVKASPRYREEQMEDKQEREQEENLESKIDTMIELLDVLKEDNQMKQETIDDLREEIKRLHYQISVKDEQLKNASQSLQNQQVLALNSNKKVEQLENQIEQDKLHQPQTEQRNKNKGIISRLFNRS